MKKQNFFQKIPARSKKYFKKLGKDWKGMSKGEKTGVIALAILTSPAISYGGFELYRRNKENIAKQLRSMT